MTLWWALTIPSLLFVTIDILRSTPESKVLKWAFVILTVFAGPLAAFFYVLGCRGPLPGSHAQYVAARWRQVLGSTMHCVAGDGIGIIVGAAIGAVLALPFWPDFLLEYTLGFGFGWAFFQAFAMRDMVGGSYLAALKSTFLSELLSMNLLMTGMILTSGFAMAHVEGSDDPARAQFWFIMSMALIAGFACAYPVNWWLVAHQMKHGMSTVAALPETAATGEMTMTGATGETHSQPVDESAQPSIAAKAAMTALTILFLAAALVIVTTIAM